MARNAVRRRPNNGASRPAQYRIADYSITNGSGNGSGGLAIASAPFPPSWISDPSKTPGPAQRAEFPIRPK